MKDERWRRRAGLVFSPLTLFMKIMMEFKSLFSPRVTALLIVHFVDSALHTSSNHGNAMQPRADAASHGIATLSAHMPPNLVPSNAFASASVRMQHRMAASFVFNFALRGRRAHTYSSTRGSHAANAKRSTDAGKDTARKTQDTHTHTHTHTHLND
jgi:hypothetical protein